MQHELLLQEDLYACYHLIAQKRAEQYVDDLHDEFPKEVDYYRSCKI
jgi:hypothetical protein